ncbi:MAG: hypothetical protein IPO44_09645 [Candidatus Microthrix sp.]|nr:DUF6328 family protein [Candidatus Microthrix sp.]MBK9559797.1 hypothetical protein [Candidatus Microthrix sp.]
MPQLTAIPITRSTRRSDRTSLPAVQVLFAFLLIAPFQQRFNRLDALERNTFSVAFLSAGLSSVLLIAPSIHQRVRAPMTGLRRHSDHHLRVTIRVALAGSAFMAIAILATISPPRRRPPGWCCSAPGCICRSLRSVGPTKPTGQAGAASKAMAFASQNARSARIRP